MKKLVLTFALSVVSVANISAQTAKQVIDNYVTALGGKQGWGKRQKRFGIPVD